MEISADMCLQALLTEEVRLEELGNWFGVRATDSRHKVGLLTSDW